ncbi:unnamed protein product [Symbiodinium natans]|uniref:Uncharacterized protein n=1 Tax=Symbiodinium natans TaxID=878477 RepID=A0A812IEM3_9DINO|nr:unnamed protein product [Symbiodinium natans]
MLASKRRSPASKPCRGVMRDSCVIYTGNCRSFHMHSAIQCKVCKWKLPDFMSAVEAQIKEDLSRERVRLKAPVRPVATPQVPTSSTPVIVDAPVTGLRDACAAETLGLLKKERTLRRS